VHCIAFISPLGGTGQTTLVANVATALAARKWTSLAIDLCAQNALGLHLGLAEPGPDGWVPAVAAGRWWGDAASENSDSVGYLPYGEAQLEETAALERLLAQPSWLGQQLHSLQLTAPTVVLMDVPQWPSPLARQALGCADVVVVCLSASLRACKAQNLLQHLFNQTEAKRAVVATDFDPRRKLQFDALQLLRQQWPDVLSSYVVHRDENVPAAMERLGCVCALTPNAQAAHDMQGVAGWIAQQCGLKAGTPS